MNSAVIVSFRDVAGSWMANCWISTRSSSPTWGRGGASWRSAPPTWWPTWRSRHRPWATRKARYSPWPSSSSFAACRLFWLLWSATGSKYSSSSCGSNVVVGMLHFLAELLWRLCLIARKLFSSQCKESVSGWCGLCLRRENAQKLHLAVAKVVVQ